MKSIKYNKMMMKKIKKLWFLPFVLFSCVVSAQSRNLSPQEQSEMEARAMQLINNFQGCLQVIADKSSSPSAISTNKKMALVNFNNQGEDCIMEVSYVSASGQEKVHRRKLPDYLHKLSKLKYRDVTIQKVEACRLTRELYQKKIDKYGNPVYTGTVTYVQNFCGTTADNRRYCDKTYKYVEIWVTYNNNSEDPAWIVTLGDVFVESTEMQVNELQILDN
jgi:hypothetical protein